MFRLIIAATLCLSAAVIRADANEKTFKTEVTDGNSILTFDCKSCAPLTKKSADAKGITLKPGEIIRKVKDVDGKLRLYRTDNMLGGSPVTTISEATETDILSYGDAAQKATLMAKLDGNSPQETGEITEPKLASDAPIGNDTTAKLIDPSHPVTTAAAMDVAADPAGQNQKQPVVVANNPAIDTGTTTSALGKKQIKPLDSDRLKLRLEEN